jgi:hypothetical protein
MEVSMRRDMLKTAAATALFGVVHSALASRAAKERMSELLGSRTGRGLYRLFYIGQSVGSLATLAAYVRRLTGTCIKRGA